MARPIDAAQLIAFRHDIHRNPEVGLDLPRTQSKVLDALDGLGFEITTGANSTSVMAVLRGGDVPSGTRPLVLLRADMDALPVEEKTGLPFASENGNMHACGHDTHTAMLVSAARALAADAAHLPGDVVFMFQPGEEQVNGAQVMIDEGLLEVAGRLPDAAAGLHVRATSPSGSFVYKPGAMMADGNSLDVVFHGAGGHGSAPHRSKDPIPALLEAIQQIQIAVARRIDAFDPVIFSPGIIQAGTRRNVIPDDARFQATIRTFTPEGRAAFRAFASQILEAVAQAHGITVEYSHIDGYPALINDPVESELGEDIIEELFGSAALTIFPHPQAGTEDFSRVLQRVPGFYMNLGACPPDRDPATAPNNHSSRAVFDDGALERGSAFEYEWVHRKLAALAAAA
jgi:hippurate hydrolase